MCHHLGQASEPIAWATMLCRAMDLPVLAVLFVMFHGINPLPRIASVAGEPAGHQDILQRLVCHASDKWVWFHLGISARWTRAIDLRDAFWACHMSVVARVYRPLSRVVQANRALEHVQDGDTRFFLVILGFLDFWMISLHFSTFCRASAHGGADAVCVCFNILENRRLASMTDDRSKVVRVAASNARLQLTRFAPGRPGMMAWAYSRKLGDTCTMG